ncbi:hypothetical protein CROQUDRAFT_654027 [Cronartium quercuum f. sp. fusiforme G11]|uniref:Uncharacterized protein n=1 Tax=Cronartium quercuum f. sp. fusiforme G11 TaxID=708437 RepID=A0A9P6TFY5_9BASI|nr:hypothetical protein CROQUDRAFT_654027 [Cronartium quercuum f. sp. fusiforme G11]
MFQLFAQRKMYYAASLPALYFAHTVNTRRQASTLGLSFQSAPNALRFPTVERSNGGV